MSLVQHSPRRSRCRAVAAGALAAVAVVATAACDAGPIGANTPLSNGGSFVPGNPGATVFAAGKGPMVPHVTGVTLTGAKISLSAYRAGHVVVLNFWGSWCVPCRAEAPALAALADRTRAEGVRFLGLNIRDSAAAAEAFESDFRISYPSISDPDDDIALAFQQTVPAAGIPTTLVIGRDGRVTARVIGGVSYNGLKAMINTAVAQAS